MGRISTSLLLCISISCLLAIRCCCARSLSAVPATAAVVVRPSATAAAPKWLSTRGRHIIDGATGQRFRLRCASWSGAQEKWYVPNGLWAQHRSVIAKQAALMGLNCIRFVWSVEAVLGPKLGTVAAVVPPEALTANPDLLGRSPLQVWDAVIKAIAKEGMLVILDNHSSDAIWCCGVQDDNGMWYNERWSERQWIESWSILAKRYANNTAVVGMGLRNEPRPNLKGSIQVPTWGTGDATSDLAIAYEKAAAAILAHRPTYLIAAQGNLAGRDLRAVQRRPLVIRTKWPDGPIVQNQLVYEVHEYPFLWGNYPFQDHPRYSAALDEAWGYIFKNNTAPIWVGEFGVEHSTAGLNSPWFQAISRYIRENELDWAFWPLDGQQGPSRELKGMETYGLLNTTWNGFAFPPMVQHLTSLG